MDQTLVRGLVQQFDGLPERDLRLVGLFPLDRGFDFLDGRSQSGAAVAIPRSPLLILTNSFFCRLVMRQNPPPRSGLKATENGVILSFFPTVTV